MRIAIFGGSFDPVHYGHLILAENCREQAELDEVWFVPCSTAPNKQKGPIATDRHRLAALQLALGGHTPFQICELELKRKGVSYTVDTLSEVRQLKPNAELFFVIGGDSLNQFHAWNEPKRICELATPLIVARPGQGSVDLDKLKPFVSSEKFRQLQTMKIDCPLIEISSTDIRNRCGAGRSIRFLTPRAVEKYLQTQNLYTKNE